MAKAKPDETLLADLGEVVTAEDVQTTLGALVKKARKGELSAARLVIAAHRAKQERGDEDGKPKPKS